MTEPAARAPAVGAVDLLTFGCELAAVVLLGVSGWSLGNSTATRLLLAVLLAVLLPGLLVAVWSRWVAPKATRRLRHPARFAAQVAVVVAVAAVTGAAGRLWWAVALVVLAVPSFGVVALRESRATPSASR